FFQAEDGIRDPLVTGVQTCALPISRMNDSNRNSIEALPRPWPSPKRVWLFILLGLAMMLLVLTFLAGTCFFIWHRSHAAQTSKRSEERRVGNDGTCRRSTCHRR